MLLALLALLATLGFVGGERSVTFLIALGLAGAVPLAGGMPLLLAGTAFILALAGTIWLWAYYGATVFFETIRAGFVACFG